MSGLIERIVRRRRASAISRPGLPTGPSTSGSDSSGSPKPWSPSSWLPVTPPPEHSASTEKALEDEPGTVLTANDAAAAGHAQPLNGHVAPAPAHGLNGTGASEEQHRNGNGQVSGEVAAALVQPGGVPAATESSADAEPVTEEMATAAAPVHAAQAPARPGLIERGRIRRRARYLRALRELQLRDLGGFLLELHRFERERPELVEAKLLGAAEVDAELRALEGSLRERSTIGELRVPGIGGACESCGAVHGSSDRFCASCGEPVSPQVTRTLVSDTERTLASETERVLASEPEQPLEADTQGTDAEIPPSAA